MAVEFWWWLTVAALVWYSTITIYVSIRGIYDIRSMFARLRALGTADETKQAR